MTPNSTITPDHDSPDAPGAGTRTRLRAPALKTQAVPNFPVSDFAVEQPRLGSAANILGMKLAGWTAVGLSRAFGSRAQGKLGIVTYHRVSPRFDRLPAPSHNVTPDRFRAHISGLLDRGFTIWPLKKLLRHRETRAALPPRTIALTFDDGFQSVYTEAFPVLRELGVPATVFLATGYLDGAAPFPFDLWGTKYRDQLPADAYRPVTFDQCQKMADSGIIDFGAHTHTHRDFRGRPEQFRADVQTSAEIVREMFSLDGVMFAFPFGSKRHGFAGSELVAAAKQTGVNCGLTTECALVDLQTDPFEWGRFNAFEWDTVDTLAAKLDGWYTWAARIKRVCAHRGSNQASAAQVPRNRAQSSGIDFKGATAASRLKSAPPGRLADAHVVSLVNILAPYERPIYLELARRVGKLTILLSSPLGLHGVDTTAWDSLDVRVQKTVTLRRAQRHPLRFDEKLDLHIPWNTVSELSELNPDLIIAHEVGFRSLLSSFYARGKSRVPLMLSVGMTEHTEMGRGIARHLLRRWLLRRADAVAVNGPGTARYVSKFGVKPERILHTPYVALRESIADVPATRDAHAAYHLLYVGQFVERKGLVPFIAALARWANAHPERTVEFSLIGSGPLEGAIRAAPVPANLTLHILGRRKPAEIAHMYAATGIFVLPTLADEWGLVVNEAMASGLPVLGSVYSQAVNELCNDDTTGWAFRTDVSLEMERAIDDALTTPIERLDEMRVAARQRVAHLTPGYVADNIVDVMDRLLSRQATANARYCGND